MLILHRDFAILLEPVALPVLRVVVWEISFENAKNKLDERARRYPGWLWDCLELPLAIALG